MSNRHVDDGGSVTIYYGADHDGQQYTGAVSLAVVFCSLAGWLRVKSSCLRAWRFMQFLSFRMSSVRGSDHSFTPAVYKVFALDVSDRMSTESGSPPKFR
jgi:hypothetical protein